MDTPQLDHQQMIEEQFLLLPFTLRQAASDPDVAIDVSSVAAQYHLDLEQEQELTNITYLTLLALMHPDDLTENIRTHLHISEGLAATITEAISARILAPVRGDIVALYDEQEAQSDWTPPQPATVAIKPIPETTTPVPTAPTAPAIPNPNLDYIPPAPPKSTSGPALITQKLSNASLAPKSRVSIDDTGSVPTPPKRNDPYRESTG
jgi:hypothetical protein